MSFRRSVLVAFVIALGLRAVTALGLPVVPTWDGEIYERAASDLARGAGFTRSALQPSSPPRPTAFYPVGWPATLSVWRAAGAPRALDPLLQAVLGALAVPLTALVAGRLAGRRSALVAAWAVALWPGGILAAASWMHEPIFTVLLLAALVPLVRSTRPSAWVLSALCFGLAAYVRPTVLATVPLAMAAAAWPRGVRWRVGAAVVGVTIALAVVAPWVARNHAAMGGAVLGTNLGSNLLIGTVSNYYVQPGPEAHCPHVRGEVASDRCRRDRALERIASDPLSWLARAPVKLFHTMGYEASSAIQLGESLGLRDAGRDPRVWALVAVCSAHWLLLIGCAVRSFRKTRERARWIVLTPFVALATVHVIFFGGDRYHAPLVPLLAALASPALGELARRIGRTGGAEASTSPSTA